MRIRTYGVVRGVELFTPSYSIFHDLVSRIYLLKTVVRQLYLSSYSSDPELIYALNLHIFFLIREDISTFVVKY